MTGDAGGSSGLWERPTLVLDPGFHTAPINRADAAAGVAVTASFDKTVRVFDVADGRHLRTIRRPAGPGNVGKAYAVAISPDGALVAAGGWMAPSPPNWIYLFNRQSGALVHRLGGLAGVVIHLAFSPDGRFLAATLGGGHGLRVFARDPRGGGDGAPGWVEVARDTDHCDHSVGAAFAPAGAYLATTSYDGRIRLYDATFARVAVRPAPDGARPFGLAFHPAGDRLAVGYADTPAVSLLDAATLGPLPAPDTAGLAGGSLVSVAWSADGAALFAGGRYGSPGTPVIAWADAGAGARRSLAASASMIMSLVPLADGDLLVAAQDPYLARLAPFDDDGGTPRWRHGPPQADLRGQHKTLAVGADGGVVDFGYDMFGEAPARFDVAGLALTLPAPADDRTAPPVQDTLPLADWVNSYRPTLDGAPLPLKPYETAFSLADHPARDRFLLGTHISLRAFDEAGDQLWRRAVPGVAWAVNVTGDGRLVVAAYGDGTIRWHRMDDGAELLAFFPLQDRENLDFVVWNEQEGIYYATARAQSILQWHVNDRNAPWDVAPEAIPVSEIAETRRPDVVKLVLPTLDVTEAIKLAELAKIRGAIRARTGATASTGQLLHVLAIGVSDYGAAAAHLRLHYADRDAEDVARALLDSQKSLYADVLPVPKLNGDATRKGILEGLATVRSNIVQGTGNDLVLVLFSGHGALVDGALYLLPHGVDGSGQLGIKDTALPVAQLKDELVKIAAHGRVLVLLDVCRSGAATADGTSFALDAGSLRAQLAQGNVTVLTSSSRDELSVERAEWENGVFTEVFLKALSEADQRRNGRLRITDVTRYLGEHVPKLTDGRQTPDFVMRGADTDIFVTL